MNSYDVVLVLLYLNALVSSRERGGVGALQRSSSPSVSLWQDKKITEKQQNPKGNIPIQ